MRPLAEALHFVLDFIYPPTCLHCATLLHKPDRHLCATCWSAIPPIAGNHPLYEETRARLLASGALSGLAAVYVFTHEGPFQSLAHALKYSGFRSIGTMLGQRLGEEMVRRGVTADVIIPMPLHTVRRRERGFNQAEVIARAVSLRIGIPLDVHLLHRVRNTGSQTKLHRHERMKNVEGAFRVSPDRQAMLEKKSSLLIDDVITTGATVISAATALREAGAAGIFAAAAALAE